MTHPDHVLQVFAVQDVYDVLHMGVQIDAGVCQIGPVTQTDQRRGKDGVPRCPEARYHEPVPRPGAFEGSIDWYENRHVRPLPILWHVPDVPEPVLAWVRSAPRLTFPSRSRSPNAR